MHINYTLDKGMTKGMLGYVKGTSLGVQIISEVDICLSNQNFFVCADARHPEVLCFRGVGWGRQPLDVVCFLVRVRGRSYTFSFFIGIKPTNL